MSIPLLALLIPRVLTFRMAKNSVRLLSSKREREPFVSIYGGAAFDCEAAYPFAVYPGDNHCLFSAGFYNARLSILSPYQPKHPPNQHLYFVNKKRSFKAESDGFKPLNIPLDKRDIYPIGWFGWSISGCWGHIKKRKMNWDNIPEFETHLAKYRKHRNIARKQLKKIQSLKKKYYFLDRIIQPRKDTDTRDDDVELEIAVQHLFESIQFKCDKPQINGDVDFRARFKGFYFGVEVKGGNLVGETETLQPFKHKIIHDDTFHPLLIYNNTKNNDSWDAVRKKISVGVKFGLLMTPELRKGYLKLINGKISWETFVNALNSTGEIKFSNKALKGTK